MRDFNKALRSPKREDQVNGLKALLPTKKDVSYAFPKHADAVGKLIEMWKNELLSTIDEGVKQEVKHGELEKVNVYDIRKREKPSKNVVQDLALFAPDILVVDVSLHYKGFLTGGTYLMWVPDRWVLMPEVGGITPSLKMINKE